MNVRILLNGSMQFKRHYLIQFFFQTHQNLVRTFPVQKLRLFVFTSLNMSLSLFLPPLLFRNQFSLTIYVKKTGL
jgi:hypothetical protein